MKKLIVAALLLTGVADASEEARIVKLEHVPFIHVSDEQVFACACPGVVDFCKRWEREWRQDAAPELRNQTARECVIDMMLVIEGDDR